jgi:hypothetical protein
MSSTFQIQELDSNWTSQVQALCYVVSTWDREQWFDYLQAFPHVQVSLDAGMNRMRGWDLFTEEVFHRLFTVPQAIPYNQLRPEVLWAHQLHLFLSESVDFSEMQVACRNNKLAAGQGTYSLIELALSILPQPPKGFQDPKTVEDWEAQYVEAQSQIVALKEAQKTLSADLQSETDPAMQQAIAQQLNQINFDLDELQSKLRKIGRQLGKASDRRLC